MDVVNLNHPPSPEPPPLPTQSQLRSRSEDRRKLIRISQRQGLTPLRLPSPAGGPGQILFEDDDIIRVPYRLSEKARELLGTSGRQASLLPQALSEAFGDLGGVREVLIGVVPKQKHFTVFVDELHPVTGEPPQLVVVTVVPLEEGEKRGRYLINHKDLYEINPKTREPFFSARHTAGELARLYSQGVR